MEIVEIILLIILIVAVIITRTPQKKEVVTKVEPKLSPEQQKKQKELKQAFDNLMNYDYETALKKKE